jgi:hypothetical protein
MNDRIKILWICDVNGWAFHNRASKLIKILNQYDHKIVFVKDIKTYEAAIAKAENHDIIITYSAGMSGENFKNRSIIGLSGGRVQMKKLKDILNV